MKKYFLLIITALFLFIPTVKAEELNCDKVLYNGLSSNQVRVLQTKLNEKAYCNLSTDGIYGSKTKSCVEKYQKNNKLGIDGKVGPETCTKLSEKTIPGTTIYITTDSVNIRKYATTTSASIAKVNKNTSFYVTKMSNNWYQVKVNNEIGYVLSSYTTTKTTTQVPQETPSYQTTTKYIVSNRYANVREYPSTSARLVTTLQQNEVVYVIEQSNGWSKILLNNKEAYIYSELITKQQQSKLSSNEYYVVASSLNVRKEANTSSKILTTVKLGTKVKVLSKTSTWSKVQISNITGYVRNDYITRDYVIVDITNQSVYLFIDNKNTLTTNVVTGMKNKHDTPLGTYILSRSNFETNRYLDGYNDDGSKYHSFVNYWMPFNGGVGFHDATWRNEFNKKIYESNGSHGCVNMNKDAAKILFDSVKSKALVTVTK